MKAVRKTKEGPGLELVDIPVREPKDHEVIGIGKDVTLVTEGDVVSAESHIFDGKCMQCRRGNMHICENLKFFGVDVDGFLPSMLSFLRRMCGRILLICQWKLRPFRNLSETACTRYSAMMWLQRLSQFSEAAQQ